METNQNIRPISEVEVPAEARDTDPEKIARFIARCRDDERFFIESCVSIRHRDTNDWVPFLFNPVQDIYERQKSRFDIILKSRKLGISTRKIAGDIWACAFSPNQNAVLVNQDKPATIKMLEERIKPILHSIKFPIKYIERRDMIIFPDTKSRYQVATAGTKTYGRGSDITRYHLSEVAQWPSWDLVTSIEEACVGDAIGCMETTARGANFFMRAWKAAVQGKSRYKPIFLPWWQDPRHRVSGLKLTCLTEEEKNLLDAFGLDLEQLAWRRQTIKEMSQPELFVQEHPATCEEAFVASGRPVFDWVAMVNYDRLAEDSKWNGRLQWSADAVEFQPAERANLHIWEQPNKKHQYVIGADIAEGLLEGAYSAAFVLDVNAASQVAEWHGRVPPDRFADVLANLGTYYNTALLAPESWPGCGNITTLRLLDMGYRNIWKRPARSNRNNPEQLWGWETTGRTRPLMLHELASAVRDYKVSLKSRGLLDELKSVIYDDGGDMISQAGCYSDRVMACAIAWYVSRDIAEGLQPEKPSLRAIERSAARQRGFFTSPKWTGPAYGVRK